MVQSFVDAKAISHAAFGQGTGLPILMDSVSCTGGEESLLDCNYDHDAGEDTHVEDSGVQCFLPAGEWYSAYIGLFSVLVQ